MAEAKEPVLRWSFDPILDSYSLVLLMSGVLVVLLLWIRPWKADRQNKRQFMLLGLRAGVIALLTIAMLRPAHVSTDSRRQTATLVILFDHSRSMNVRDSVGGQTRWEQLKSSLDMSRDELRRLGDAIEIRAYGFADVLGNNRFSEGTVQLPPSANGDQTDIALALSESLRRENGKRIAAVLLLSDGAQRVLMPQFDLQQAARELARMNTPLYTVPFGKGRDQSQARDVSIERLQDQYTVFVNNELAIRGALRVQGYVNRPIAVQFKIDGPDGVESKTMGTIELTARQDDALVDFAFDYSPTQPGAYKLTVEATPQDGELVVANNRLTAYLNVLEGGLRVLYFESNLVGPEPQIIRRSLATSPDIELDFFPIDPRRQDVWPIDLANVLDRAAYDVLLIGDVDSTAIGPAGGSRIVDWVQSGKGLMMTGGLNTFGPGGYFNSPLAELLPVNMGQIERQPMGHDQEVRPDVHIPGPITMIPSRPHFITHLAGGDENLRAWRKLKPLLGANRFESIKSGQQAIRLAETEAGDPLLLARQYGDGRVLVFAADSTHRWWRYGQQDAHRRFWRQAMLWLANKDDLLRRDVWVRLPRRRFRVGEAVPFSAGARAENGDVLNDAELAATLRGGQEEVPIRMTRDGENWAADIDALVDPGEYQVHVVAQLDGQKIGESTARFTVQSLDLELSDPAADARQLDLLSRRTQDAGGRSIAAEKLPELLRELIDKPREMEIEVETKWRFGDSLAVSWPFFVLVMVLLSTEWFLRKKWGLN